MFLKNKFSIKIQTPEDRDSDLKLTVCAAQNSGSKIGPLSHRYDLLTFVLKENFFLQGKNLFDLEKINDYGHEFCNGAMLHSMHAHERSFNEQARINKNRILTFLTLNCLHLGQFFKRSKNVRLTLTAHKNKNQPL